MEDLFSCNIPKFKISKPIRLIELFAGIGSQAKALENLGADFETYKVCEFDKYAVASYNAVHGTDFAVSDITRLKGIDLEITNTSDYQYLLTYSFPCTDLSVAGKMQGMGKDSGTRSGLLWQVERVLKECKELANSNSEYGLPQVLLMENVPQVHSEENLKDFGSWVLFLESLGYRNFYEDLNAKNYGIAQNRNRCFMVSILGDYSYTFPEPIELDTCIKDYLEPKVDEKFYINSETAQKLIDTLIENGTIGSQNRTEQNRTEQNRTEQNRTEQNRTVDLSVNEPREIGVANCIKARYDAGVSNFKSDGTGVCELC